VDGVVLRTVSGLLNPNRPRYRRSHLRAVRLGRRLCRDRHRPRLGIGASGRDGLLREPHLRLPRRNGEVERLALHAHHVLVDLTAIGPAAAKLTQDPLSDTLGCDSAI